jgi:glycosyltransferase involved in cell wall biosynthesis
MKILARVRKLFAPKIIHNQSEKEFIVLLSVDFLPHIGGISLMTHELANALVDNGENVLLVAPEGSYIPSEFKNKYHFLIDERFSKKARSGEDAAKQDTRIYSLLNKISNNYKIKRFLLLHPFCYGVSSVDFAKSKNIPISIYFHGFEIRSQLLDGYPKNQKKLVENRLVKSLRERTFYSIALCDQICVNSNYTKAIFNGFTLKPDILVTGCGVSLEYYNKYKHIHIDELAAMKSKVKSRFGYSDEIVIVFSGRLVINKNVSSILKMLVHNSNLRAVIIGDGPMKESLVNYAQVNKIEKRVEFTGKISEQEKWEYLEAADFAALLSIEIEKTGNVEGFGITLIEGALVGAIPITSGTGGMIDIVSSGDSGLILKNGEEKDNAKEIVKLYRDNQRYNRIRNNARLQVIEKFNWHSISKKITRSWDD